MMFIAAIDIFEWWHWNDADENRFGIWYDAFNNAGWMWT
jgi:hypothetical protein